MKKIVAIHQPNFFPWLGYFDKIASSDEFIILDDVQFPKGDYVNRVKLLVAGDGRWITAPVKHDLQGKIKINEMSFDDRPPWRKKMIKTIEANYRKKEFYHENAEFIYALISNSNSNIAEYNTANILELINYLGLQKHKIILASDFNVTTTSTQRIIDLVKMCDANTYLSGGGASGYQEDPLYAENGIELVYQNYQHPIYEQKNKVGFIKGLSIIDALMNIGKEQLQKLLFKESKNA